MSRWRCLGAATGAGFRGRRATATHAGWHGGLAVAPLRDCKSEGKSTGRRPWGPLGPVAAAWRRAGAPYFEVASAVAWQSEAYWSRWRCWSRRGSELRRVGRSWTPLSRVGGCARWWTGRGCWDAETRGSAIDSAICVCRGSVLGRCVLCGCERGHVAEISPHHHGRGWWEGDSADRGVWASGMHK